MARVNQVTRVAVPGHTTAGAPSSRTGRTGDPDAIGRFEGDEASVVVPGVGLRPGRVRPVGDPRHAQGVWAARAFFRRGAGRGLVLSCACVAAFPCAHVAHAPGRIDGRSAFVRRSIGRSVKVRRIRTAPRLGIWSVLRSSSRGPRHLGGATTLPLHDCAARRGTSPRGNPQSWVRSRNGGRTGLRPPGPRWATIDGISRRRPGSRSSVPCALRAARARRRPSSSRCCPGGTRRS